MRIIHRLRNKKLGELQKKMSHCRKDSKQWKKYNQAKKFILSKSDRQFKDTAHKSTKQFVDLCLKEQVTNVVIGNPDGVQKKSKAKKEKRPLKNYRIGLLVKSIKSLNTNL
ncbi:MAG: hypothetical protein JW702_02925, partial [Clostridiales bacterium]|nr:hypothetical protein [Clostridiales bacterium]